MKSVEKRARTVEEAVELALRELGVPRERVDVTVVEEASKGLFGLIGTKDAVVRVTVREDKKEEVAKFVTEICRSMKLAGRVQTSEDDEYIYCSITGRDLGVLIGRRGQTLDALQYLINVAMSRKSDDRRKVILDVEGYREKRRRSLERLAVRMSEKVRRTGYRAVLEPMNSHERKIIHLTLQADPHVKTHSEGEEPFRKVIIEPAK